MASPSAKLLMVAVNWGFIDGKHLAFMGEAPAECGIYRIGQLGMAEGK